METTGRVQEQLPASSSRCQERLAKRAQGSYSWFVWDFAAVCLLFFFVFLRSRRTPTLRGRATQARVHSLVFSIKCFLFFLFYKRCWCYTGRLSFFFILFTSSPLLLSLAAPFFPSAPPPASCLSSRPARRRSPARPPAAASSAPRVPARVNERRKGKREVEG